MLSSNPRHTSRSDACVRPEHSLRMLANLPRDFGLGGGQLAVLFLAHLHARLPSGSVQEAAVFAVSNWTPCPAPRQDLT